MHPALFIFLFTFFYLSFSRNPVQGRRLLSPYIPPHSLPAISFLPIITTATTVKAYALPGWKRDDQPCTDSDSDSALASSIPSPTSIIDSISGGGITPVTVTVTFFTPNQSSYSTTTPLAQESGTNVTGTTVTDSTQIITTSSSTVMPSTSAVPPLVASAQQAQILNAGFTTLRAGDTCTPGERACIGTNIAECSTPVSSSQQPRWITQLCVISDFNEASICAAVPSSNITTTSSNTTTAVNTSSNSSLSTNDSTPPTELGCFPPTNITQLFTNAGVSGGMYPPGFQQSSTASMKNNLNGKGIGVIGFSALIAGLLIW